jgi:hypothetical protein
LTLRLGLPASSVLTDFEDLERSGATEPQYQELLKTNSWVLSQLYAAPVVLIENQPYVEGKEVSNREKLCDFLYKMS